MLKFFKILASLCTLVIAISVVVYFIFRTPTTGTVELTGLKAPVTVKRDTYGVPHIEAQNDEDAYFALGYIHAQDRLWQMEFQRHISQGTLSEMFGDATITEDKFLRTLGFYRAATLAWNALSPRAQTLFHAYSTGINRFIETGNLPLQFKLLHYQPHAWSDVDTIAWQKMMAWDLQSTWKEKIENYVIANQFGKDQIAVLLPGYPKDAPNILSDQDLKNVSTKQLAHAHDELINQKFNAPQINRILDATNKINSRLHFNDVPGKGSNNWVVSGRFTKSHKPMLANDPHLSLSAPMLWYLADIKTPYFHSVGATIPGLPIVVIGHNDYIAWGVTDGCVDAQDLYIEPDNAKITTFSEVIKVKGKPDVVYPVRVSEHGPIISDVSDASKIGKHIALQWTALMSNDTTMESFLELNYAKNWDDFRQALKKFIVPSQNFIYADTQGNIGYYLSGKLPIRKGWTGEMPVAGHQAFEWNEYIPFDKMPHTFNPPEGYIVSANNQVASSHYPYSLAYRCGVAPYRAQRIIDSIVHHPAPLTISDMAAIQNDTVSYLWKDFRSILLQTAPFNERSQKALVLLSQWDGNVQRNSVAATLFEYWYKQFNQLTPVTIRQLSEWPEPQFIKQQLAENGPYCQRAGAKDCKQFLSISLDRAMSELIKQHGHNDKQWAWGKVHHAVFSELGLGTVNAIGWLWNREISTSGDPYTVNVGSYDFNDFHQIEGPGYRQIIDLNNWKNSRYIQALGQTDSIVNRHHSDLMPLWRDGKYLSMDVSQNKNVEILRLVPHE